MVVLSQVVVVELNQGLDGLLHCGHLDQGHLAVFSRKNKQISKLLHFFFGAKLSVRKWLQGHKHSEREPDHGEKYT